MNNVNPLDPEDGGLEFDLIQIVRRNLFGPLLHGNFYLGELPVVILMDLGKIWGEAKMLPREEPL